jgi:hypothetical protein
MTTLATLTADILSYSTYDSDDFVAMIPRFIQQSELRTFYFCQLPNFRRAQTGAMTAGNPYLQLPDDFLAASSVSIDTGPLTGWKFLLNKDVEYIREVYPVISSTGEPFAYALFDADADDTTIIIGPTPDQSYDTQLNYFYLPASLTVDTTGTWLSEHDYDVLLMGALSESATWLKKTAGIDSMGDTYEQRFLIGLQGLKNLGEARDRKDTYRSGEKRKAEMN